MHSTTNMDDGYLGSGKVLKSAIKKYGESAFTRTILMTFDSFEEMAENERALVNQKMVDDPTYYNMRVGGIGFAPGHTVGKGRCKSEEHRRKISINQIERFKDPTNHPSFGKAQSVETKRKRSISMTGKTFGPMSDARKLAISIGTTGKKHKPMSEEQKRFISVSQTGKKRGPYKLKAA